MLIKGSYVIGDGDVSKVDGPKHVPKIQAFSVLREDMSKYELTGKCRGCIDMQRSCKSHSALRGMSSEFKGQIGARWRRRWKQPRRKR